MKKFLSSSLFYLLFVLFVALVSFAFVWNESSKAHKFLDNWIGESKDIVFDGIEEGDPDLNNVLAEVKLKQKPEKIVAKAIYLTAYSAGSEKKLNAMIDLINKTELNAVVIDIKDYSGYLLYDSNIEMVNELGVEDNRLGDVTAMIEKLHENDIYVIARQTVFQDPILAEKKPEYALKNTWGTLWRDHKGLAWVDANNRDVWKYNMDIAKEAIELGFDEINLDYVRFPSDGNLKAIVYTNGDKARYDVMGEFFAYVEEELENEPAHTSIDMFGFVMERHDGMSIGQRLEDAVDHIDYICPMMYPSHYPSGHLGLANPAAHPKIIFDNGMEKGAPYFEGQKAEVRPWIQAFHMGAQYGAANIRAQIDAIEKFDNAGWLMWNASNRYSTAGLKLAKEVE